MKDISPGDIEVSDIAYSWDSDIEIEEDEASGLAIRNKHMQDRRQVKLDLRLVGIDAAFTSPSEGSTAPFGVLGVGTWKT